MRGGPPLLSLDLHYGKVPKPVPLVSILTLYISTITLISTTHLNTSVHFVRHHGNQPPR